MIRIDAAWLATAPLDMRAGTDSALARVVKVFSLPVRRVLAKLLKVWGLLSSRAIQSYKVYIERVRSQITDEKMSIT